MKTGKSSLNVNAASYIPLCERGAAGRGKDHPLMAKGSESRNAPVGVDSHLTSSTLNYHPSKTSQNYSDHRNPTSEVYSWKGTSSHGSCGSSSKSPIDMWQKDFLDEQFDMDLAYLQMTFPDFSDESLSHIYLANRGDLETTVDMLDLLEFCPGDSSELLPDTPEIGDPSESQSSKGCASLKLKEVADEIAGSSGSSNQHPLPN